MSDTPSSKQPELTEGSLLGMTALQGLVFTALGLGIWAFTGRAIEDWVSFTLHDVFIGLASTALLVSIALFGFFFPRINRYLVELQAESYGWLTRFNSWRVILIISFFAGTWEEALFRGGLQVLLGDYMAAPLAIVLASAVFAAIHLTKPIIGFLQFLIGCVLGVVYWQTGSLLGVMIAHFLYDVFALWYLLRELTKLEQERAHAAPD